MATSSKVQFNLATLSEKAITAIDNRIAQKQAETISMDSPEQKAERLAAWRKAQESKLSHIFAQLDTIDNLSLSKFKLDALPDQSSWDYSNVRRDLVRLQSDRERIIAKAASLVPDADGNIALTKTQLREFFEL